LRSGGLASGDILWYNIMKINIKIKLTENMENKHVCHLSIYSIFTAVFLACLFINTTTHAAWGLDCAGFPGGSLTVNPGQTCILNGGSETITSLTVQSGGILKLNGATLIIDGPVDISGQVDNEGSTFHLQNTAGWGVFNLFSGGLINNAGIFTVESTVGGITANINSGSTFNNYTGSTANFIRAAGFSGSVNVSGNFTSSAAVEMGSEDIGVVSYGVDFNITNGGNVTTSGTGNFNVWGNSIMQNGCVWNNTGTNIVLKQELRLERSGPIPLPGSPVLTNSAGGHIEAETVNILIESTLNNYGTIDIVAPGGGGYSFSINNSTLNNYSGGVINVADNDMNSFDLIEGSLFNNEAGSVINVAGPFHMSSWVAEYTILNNGGEINATYLNSSGKGEIDNTGTIAMVPTDGNGIVFNNVEFILNNSGTISISGNYMVFNGGDINLLNGSQITAPIITATTATPIVADAGSQMDVTDVLRLWGASTMINGGVLNALNFTVIEGSVLTNNNTINSTNEGAVYGAGSQIINSNGATINSNNFFIGAMGQLNGLLTNSGNIDLDNLDKKFEILVKIYCNNLKNIIKKINHY